MNSSSVKAQQGIYKDPVSFKFKNGLTLIVAENHSTPKVYAGFSFDEGIETDTQKTSTLNLISRLYNVSAKKEEFKDNFLSMFDALKKPEITLDDFSKIKKQLRLDLHTKNHPYGELVTEAVVEGLTFEDLHAFYKTRVNSNRAYITIAGDISPAVARALVEKALAETDLTNAVLENDDTLNRLI